MVSWWYSLSDLFRVTLLFIIGGFWPSMVPPEPHWQKLGKGQSSTETFYFLPKDNAFMHCL